jgi:hypothetical protein
VQVKNERGYKQNKQNKCKKGKGNRDVNYKKRK